jgi:hypothetical protein
LYGLDIPDAIKRCRELVDDDSKITLDVYVYGAGNVSHYNPANLTNALDNFERYRQIKQEPFKNRMFIY